MGDGGVSEKGQMEEQAGTSLGYDREYLRDSKWYCRFSPLRDFTFRKVSRISYRIFNWWAYYKELYNRKVSLLGSFKFSIRNIKILSGQKSIFENLVFFLFAFRIWMKKEVSSVMPIWLDNLCLESLRLGQIFPQRYNVCVYLCVLSMFLNLLSCKFKQWIPSVIDRNF